MHVSDRWRFSNEPKLKYKNLIKGGESNIKSRGSYGPKFTRGALPDTGGGGGVPAILFKRL